MKTQTTIERRLQKARTDASYSTTPSLALSCSGLKGRESRSIKTMATDGDLALLQP